MNKLCKCGCGLFVRKSNHIFVKYHNKKGSLNPNYNKKWTDKQKQNMSLINKELYRKEPERKIFLRNIHLGKKSLQSTKDKISLATKGKNNPFYGKHHTKESIQKISGKNNGMYGKPTPFPKGQYYIKKDGSKIWLRSSYEIAYAKYLDSKEIDWIYEPKRFILKTINRTYLPDFYLPKEDEYIEIKGYLDKTSFLLFDTFKKEYSNIKIIMIHGKKELRKIGVLI